MVRLGDICTKGSSNIAQKDLDARNGAYPIYGASGFIKNVDFYHQEKPYVAVVKDGAGVGRVMLLPAKSSVIGTMQYIIPNDDVNVEYLAYALEKMDLAKYYSGATIPHIYFKDYCMEELPVHSADEQRQIASILNQVSILIDLRKQQLSKLDELVKSQFIEMFGTPESVMDSAHTIDEVADVQVGIVIKPTRFYADGNNGIKAFRSLNIGPMCIKDDDWVYFTEDAMKETQRTIAHADDILVVRSGNPGTSCVVPPEYDGCNVIDLIIAHPNKEKVLPEYLSAFTNMPHGMNQINSQQRGVAQKHFNVGMYKDLKLILPSLDKQKQFVDFLKQSDKSKFEIQKSLEKLETLKKALMQKYFG